MAALQENAVTKLITVTGVDLNVLTPTQLYVVPAGKKLLATFFVFREATISLTTAEWSIGFNNPDYDNVSIAAMQTGLTSSALYAILYASNGGSGTLGNSGDVLTLQPTIAQGAAATITVDVFGYLI